MAITYFNIPPNGIISQIQAIVLYKISDFVSLRYQPASISSTGGQVFIECDSEKALARLVFDGTYWDLQIDHYVHDTESEIYKFAAANRYEPFVVHFKHNGIWYLTGDADLPYTIRNEFASGTAPEESRNHLLKISGKFYQRPEQAANDAVLLEYATTYLIKSQGTKGGVMNMAFIDESDIISTLESDDTLLDMQIVDALSREVDIFQFEDGTQFNIIRDGERLSTASISSEIQNIPSGFMEYLLEKRYSHKVGIIEMNDGERYVVGSKKHPVRWDIKEDQGTDTQMVVIDFRFEARQSIKLYEGLDKYLSNDIPLFDQFPQFFENGFAFSMVKISETYTGQCLRVSHPVSLVEQDIAFTTFGGRDWIDAQVAQEFLDASSNPDDLPLRVVKGYLQGLNMTTGILSDTLPLANAMYLYLDPANPKNCEVYSVAVENEINYLNWAKLRFLNPRTSTGSFRLDSNTRMRALDITVSRFIENFTNATFFQGYNIAGEQYISGTDTQSRFAANTTNFKVYIFPSFDKAQYTLKGFLIDQSTAIASEDFIWRNIIYKYDSLEFPLAGYNRNNDPFASSITSIGGSLRSQTFVRSDQAIGFKFYVKTIDDLTNFDNITSQGITEVRNAINKIFGTQQTYEDFP